MRDTFIQTLSDAASTDPNIALIVGDLGFGVVDQFARELPEQFLNAGVAEQNMIGVAAGMAATGYRVFVYSIANFPTLRALEQIRNDVCYHRLDVTIVSVGAGVSYGTLGYTHHAVEDLAVMRVLPGMRVLCPADPIEARAAVDEALAFRGPTYVRLGKNGERTLHVSDDRPNLREPLQLREGQDVVLLATGAIAESCLKAAEQLQDSGISAAVLSWPTVKPLDHKWLQTADPRVPILTVEEHTRDGGFGSAVLEAANDLGLQLSITRLGLTSESISAIGSADYIRSAHGLDARSIASAARRAVAACTESKPGRS